MILGLVISYLRFTSTLVLDKQLGLFIKLSNVKTTL